MIDLRKAVPYEFIDDVVIEIFDKYKWGLKHVGVDLSQEILETIVYCSPNLENALIAFCGWVLSMQESGEKLTHETLKSTLIDALKEGWIPSKSQEKIVVNYYDILESPKEKIWKEAEKILGYDLRNKILSDITEKGELIFRDDLNLSVDDYGRITQLKAFILDLDLDLD